jgi:ubiquinone/menaquinone biosynthesis C-methylase UbiE
MFQKMIFAQYRRPTGLLGRWIGQRMAQQHVAENEWTVRLLDAQPGDHVLEIGFGPGLAIQKLLQQVPQVQIAGVDYSQTMVNAARQRNLKAITEGHADLRYGDAANLPFADTVFDRVYSIHSIYFWPRPLYTLREIRRVLKPGGILILTIQPEPEEAERSDPLEASSDFTGYSGRRLEALLREAGFAETRIEIDVPGSSLSNYSVLATLQKH